MIFTKKSNVTLVLTSCGRFNLLKKTLDSLKKNNTYPIHKIIITEDSGNKEVFSYIPEEWADHCEIIINNPKLGQMKSIDLAYSKVTTDFIFHCEDDWLFYRAGFIEDSMSILNSDPNILQVWLRDYQTDIKKHYPFHSLGIEEKVDNIPYFKLKSNHAIWTGFSLNPGLRRLADYYKVAPFDNSVSSNIREGEIATLYNKLNMYAVILKDSAIKHIGWKDHILTTSEKIEIKNKKIKKIKHIIIGFLLGLLSHLIYFL